MTLTTPLPSLIKRRAEDVQATASWPTGSQAGQGVGPSARSVWRKRSGLQAQAHSPHLPGGPLIAPGRLMLQLCR